MLIFHHIKEIGDGGDWKSLIDLASWQVGQGHKVHIAGTWVSSKRHHLPEGVYCHDLPLNTGPISRGRLLRRIRAEHEQLVGSKIVWHAHTPNAALAAWLANRRIPVIATNHWSPPISLLRRFAKGQILRRCSEIIAPSNETAEQLRHDHGNLKIQVIPYGIDESDYTLAVASDIEKARDELGLPKLGSVVGFIGRLNDEKRIDVLLRAFRVVLGRGHGGTLVIAGDGGLRSALPQMARRLGIQSHVKFLGRVQNPKCFYHAVDLTVLPSDHETFGLVVIESLLCGKPVLRTATEGHSHQIVSGENGDVFPRGDVDQLAKLLIYWLRRDTSSETMLRKCRATVEGRFTLDRCGYATESLYDRALSRRNRR